MPVGPRGGVYFINASGKKCYGAPHEATARPAPIQAPVSTTQGVPQKPAMQRGAPDRAETKPETKISTATDGSGTKYTSLQFTGRKNADIAAFHRGVARMHEMDGNAVMAAKNREVADKYDKRQTRDDKRAAKSK